MIHGFIEKFVNDDKVVTDGFFVECGEVILE